MKLAVHVLTHDDEQMFDWALRHWRKLGAVIYVHDGGPTHKSSASNALGDWSTTVWDTAGQLNDDLACKLKNGCWKGTDADWVAVVDADELLHFPEGAEKTLAAYTRNGAAVVKPSGFEMFSDVWFEPSDHPNQQITSIVKDGAPDDEWYAKPILFNPKMIAESGFGIGAHESNPVLHDGRSFHVGRNWPKANPPTYLLHFKSIFGGLDRIAARYDATRQRLAAVNVRNSWGNFKPGMEHALEKRERLFPHVRRVIA